MDNKMSVLGLILFALVIADCIYEAVEKPYHNWDMIMYMAAAKSFEEPDPEELHRFTFAELKRSVPEHTYQQLTRSADYRVAIARDSSAFGEQLPFYQIRPIYNGAIYLLYKSGLQLAKATYLVSLLSVLIGICFVFLSIHRRLPNRLMMVVPMAMMVFSVGTLGRYSTPDGMGFMAMCMISYFYLSRKFHPVLLLAPLIVLIRTDLILLSLLMVGAVWVTRPGLRRHALVSGLGCLAVNFSLQTFWGNAGWSTIFYFTFVQKLTHPITAEPQLTVAQYQAVFSRGLMGLLNDGFFWLFMVLSYLSACYYWKKDWLASFRSWQQSQAAQLSLICLVFAGAHFVLFPAMWLRFFVATYLMAAISLLLLFHGQQQRSAMHVRSRAAQSTDRVGVSEMP